MKDSALALLAQGYSVVPCKPDQRFPTIAWAEYQHRHATVSEIERWWEEEPNANIAIVTGEISGVTVVDIDGTEGLKAMAQAGVILPPTRIIKSPHGWHAYYSYVHGVPSRAGVYPKVDVKNNGGCVCSPPSVVNLSLIHI